MPRFKMPRSSPMGRQVQKLLFNPNAFRLNFKFEMVVHPRQFNKSKWYWDRIARTPAQDAAMWVAYIGRKSIRRGKISTTKKVLALKGRRNRPERKPSRAPKPPKTWVAGDHGLRRIFAVPGGGMLGKYVRFIAGPEGWKDKGGHTIPELHEYGGRVQRTVYVDKDRRSDKRGRYTKASVERKRMTVSYPKRATMEPALDRAVRSGKLPTMWAGSLSRS